MRSWLMLASGLTAAGCGTSSSNVDQTDAGDASVREAAAPVDAGADSAVDAAYAPTAAEQAAFTALVTDTTKTLSSTGTPGASIAVVLHGKLAFAQGIGKKNLSSGAAVTTATLFRVASMSKMVVAATAMSLVDEGKLDLSTPITTYLPWFSLKPGFDARTVTPALLLSHSSGFPSDTISQCGTGTTGPRQAFFASAPQPLWDPPGTVYDYSNTGFALMATVLEAAAGLTDGAYERLAHDRVFIPAAMTTATFDAAAAQGGDHATGYELNAQGVATATIEPTDLACPLLDPPGGILATATDYAHFAEMLLSEGGTTLQASSAAQMQAPHVDMRTFATQEYGYGLIHQLAPYSDHASVWHNGSLPGFLSELWMVPDRGFAIVALVNAAGTSAVADTIVADALRAFIPEAESVPAFTTPSSAWTGYAGTYDDPWGTLGAGIAVSLDKADSGASTLLVSAPNSTDFAGNSQPVSGIMQQSAGDTWAMPDGTAVTFFPGDAGTYAYFATRRGVGVR